MLSKIVLSIFVLFLHLTLFSSFLDIGTNLVLFSTNLCVLFLGIKYYRSLSPLRFTLYLVGYLILFLFIFAFLNAPLLFSLFIIMYASLFRLPALLGYLLIFIFSVMVMTPYWIQFFALISLFYTILLGLYIKRHSTFLVITFSIGFFLLIIVCLPILYIMIQSTPQSILVSVKDPKLVESIKNSLLTSTISTLIVLVFGVPLAYAMAHTEFRGKRIVESMIDLPILVPQTVAGIAFLVLAGPKTPLGDFLNGAFGISIAGSFLGIIAAQVFVSSPFLIRSAISAFELIDHNLEVASRTLGASNLSTFFKISLPLAFGGIFNGVILTWSRAISEVGTLMIVAYYPKTAPVYLYDQFIQYGLSETKPAAILLIIICLWIFIVMRWLRYYPIGRKLVRA
ncbi:MAG: ABC transporter permease subunit [Candidatus Omnitrophica bacterium]|nr:ABC transporter permease subunit [Candidatus Omnitrophota bacterium]